MKKLNRFFETPKRAAVSVGCIAAVAFFGAGTVFAAGILVKQNSVRAENQAGAKETGSVTLDGAIAAALYDAGLDSEEVTVTKANRDTDNGIIIYDIEFIAGNTEYEYEIYEDTGAVYSKSKETTVVQAGTEVQQGTDAQPGSDAGSQISLDGAKNIAVSDAGSAGTDIGLEQAKATALNHAGCQASEVHFAKAKFEKEHGSGIYEVEFYKDGIEYEYTIDASTGEILEFESEEND